MKRKVRTRLLSGLMTFAMLISLVPAAFAASYDYYGEMNSSGYCDLDDTDFFSSSLYSKCSYFVIEPEKDAPAVKIGRSYVDGDLLYYEDSNSYDNIHDVSFDEDDATYSDDYYDYEIYGYLSTTDYSKDDEWGSVTVRIYVDGSSSSAEGDIYAETDANGYLDMDEIAEELYDLANDKMASKEYPSYVKFSTSDGSIVDDDDDEYSSSSKFYFNDDGDAFEEYVYFLADDPDEESEVSFTVYGDSESTFKGTIVVNGDGSTVSGDIKYSGAYNSTVEFKGSDFESLLSSNQTLSYVTFTLPSSSKGVLYWGNSALSSKDQLDEDDLDDVTFEPKSGVSGSVSISFKLYYKTSSSSSTRSKSGTVAITIDDGTTISYSAEVDDEIEFDSGDFDDVCYDKTGKELLYVKFSLPSSSKGVLYSEYDGTSKGSTKAKSSDEFYVDPGKNDLALDDVVFVPSASGTIEFSYTAYYSSSKSFTGKVKVTVTAGTLSAINYTVSGDSVTFSASDFTAALKEKTSRTLSSVTFTLPSSSQGTLYYNGSTKVSASTQYKSSGSSNSLDKVSFVPASGASGNVTIAYTAKDSSGNAYSGTVVVTTFVGQDTVLTYTTTGRAVNFAVTDFQNACLKKLNTTLSYVQFSLPSASQGTLYYAYGTSQQARATENSKYTVSTYLQYISFLPKAGFSGTATITYTGYDTAGKSYTGTINVTVTPPAVSSYFTDATESWIAPAADFLYINGAYSGVISGTTLGVRNQITRGEVMQMIYNAFNLQNQVGTVTSNFSDVPATHAYYTAINAGYALGIALGDQGMFRPNEPITRQDAMTLLYRAFTKLGLNLTTGTASDLTVFADYAKVDSYATDALASMVKSGIIQGDNGNINPKGNLTRGEMSVILYRAMTL